MRRVGVVEAAALGVRQWHRGVEEESRSLKRAERMHQVVGQVLPRREGVVHHHGARRILVTRGEDNPLGTPGDRAHRGVHGSVGSIVDDEYGVTRKVQPDAPRVLTPDEIVVGAPDLCYMARGGGQWVSSMGWGTRRRRYARDGG